MLIAEQIIHEMWQVSLWEWLAFGTGLGYIILVLLKKTSAWIIGVLSSALYVKICFSAQLYLDGVLQLFYVIMGIYGWWVWHSKTAKEAQIIQMWPLKKHLWSILFSAFLVLLTGFIFSHYTGQAKPYTDAFITIYSLLATYMVAHKVLENWLYWICIDALSVYLFASQGLYLTSLLYLVYAIMAVIGYFKWKKDFKLHMP